MAVISGPSFAIEVANKKPTAVTIASGSKNFRNQLAEDLSDQNFRVYTSDDIIGAEIGGAIKNIIAIGAGISDGLNYGDNGADGTLEQNGENPENHKEILNKTVGERFSKINHFTHCK